MRNKIRAQRQQLRNKDDEDYNQLTTATLHERKGTRHKTTISDYVHVWAKNVKVYSTRSVSNGWQSFVERRFAPNRSNTDQLNNMHTTEVLEKKRTEADGGWKITFVLFTLFSPWLFFIFYIHFECTYYMRTFVRTKMKTSINYPLHCRRVKLKIQPKYNEWMNLFWMTKHKNRQYYALNT